MTNPTDVENLRPVLNKILQRHQLSTQDIKKEKSWIEVSDSGQFTCDHCVRTWRSMFSWICFDLIELEITYRYRMKCKQCLTMCIPKFSIEQLENMFDRCVKFYKGEPITGVGYRGRRTTFTEPHHPHLCEKCGWGSAQCWFKRIYMVNVNMYNVPV